MADYGTVAEVEALTKRYTNSGSFDGTTNPTSTQIGNFLVQLSSNLNVLLAGEGFTIPISSSVVKPMIDNIVVIYARDMVEFANSAGRFFTDKRLKSGNIMRWIGMDLAEWIENNANGLEAAGAARSQTLAGGILAKTVDSDGNTIEPFFDTSGFGVRRPTS